VIRDASSGGFVRFGCFDRRLVHRGHGARQRPDPAVREMPQTVRAIVAMARGFTNQLPRVAGVCAYRLSAADEQPGQAALTCDRNSPQSIRP